VSRTTFGALGTLVGLFGLAVPASADHAVQFRGHATGAITAASPVALGLLIQTEATGQATRIGEFSRTEVLLLDPATSTIAGLVAFRAANGDTLTGVVTGSFVSATQATGHYRFTGGTGRFAGASGKASFTLETPDGATFAVQFNGLINGLKP
jgi:hypothetical protein